MSPSTFYLSLALEALGLVLFLGGYVLGYRSGYTKALQWCVQYHKYELDKLEQEPSK